MARFAPTLGTILSLGAVALAVLSFNSDFGRDVWTREAPLVGALAVVSVADGKVTLADGRVFAPAGISRDPKVSPAEYDVALRIACAQGVTVIRDLGDGRAFLRGEPKFYNWCGTRDRDGSWWAGGSFQSPISELLVVTRYAEACLDEPGLLAIERWRLEGVTHGDVFTLQNQPTVISSAGDAFRYGGHERHLGDLDEMLSSWKQPPSDAETDNRGP